MTVLTFVPSMRPGPPPAPHDLGVAVIGRTALLAVDDDRGWRLPTLGELGASRDLAPLGAMNGRSVWLAPAVSTPDGLHRLAWIDILTAVPPAVAEAVARGLHLADWRDGRRFCGACGALAEDVPGMPARRCPGCGRVEYAHAQPVALVGIWRGDRAGHPEILLARHTYGASFWALVGGYLDPAEGLEAAGRRETVEEVGLEVTDLRYYGSEGWGMDGPTSVIAVFLARAADPAAEPVVDGVELAEARYFPIDALPPETPPAPLIAARFLADLPGLLG